MDLIKNVLKKIFNKKKIEYLNTVYKYYRYNHSLFKTLGFLIKGLFVSYIPKDNVSRGEQLKQSFSRIKVDCSIKDGFVYFIDPYKIPYSNKKINDNFTVNYDIILKKSLSDFYNINLQLKDSEYKDNQKNTLDAISILIDNTICELKKNKVSKKYIKFFENMKNNKTSSFEEALQRILFYNQLLWQTGHSLNGLGRLDQMLYEYYKNDIKNNVITEKKAYEMLKNFMKTLHSYYWLKSSSLLGDTGQIVILSGINEKGKYMCNKLTYMFIEVVKDLCLPDPKVLLRVSNDIPRDLMELSLNTIKTGIGSPLFANDGVIIPKLLEFGYDKAAYNYCTSACWEPLIIEKSVEHNNIDTFIFMVPFNKMLDSEDLSKIKNIDSLLKMYYKYLKEYSRDIIKHIESIEFEENPLVSLFIPNCNRVLKDVNAGGAVYNNYGITSVSLANVVNSIINIDKFVFNDKRINLVEFNNIRKNNFKDNEKLLEELKSNSIKYGLDDNYVLDLVNNITDYVNDIFANTYLKNNGRIKFGLSSPNYIVDSLSAPASFDGRKDGEPFTVHISSSIPSLSYTELFRFASHLDYTGNRFNGNVIDFIVTPNFIEDNFDKFIDFLMLSINVGFFETQMNVISSDILIKAKNNPQAFPNLVVRVWGFSAYFNDLPEEYKNVLIERALLNEGKSN